MTCIVCTHRPAKEKGICAVCSEKIAKEWGRKTAMQPKHFLTYRGHVVGLFPVGGGELRPELLNRKVKNLPKLKTLDLNTYLVGFDRVKIKAFKACVLQLANPRLRKN